MLSVYKFLPKAPLSLPVRVLIADDHLLFAEALSTILEPDQRITVVGRAANGEQAVKLTRKLTDDGGPAIFEASFLAENTFVAVDVLTPQDDGFQLTELKSSSLRMIDRS